MALTREQFARANAAEERQLRLAQLLRFSYRELQQLLEGDPAEAAAWIRSAADCGLIAAQLRLGRMLLEGRGVPLDPAAALAWFQRAAARGDAGALNMVGRCLENGWGCEPHTVQAAAQYRASAERGYDWGEYNFANLLFDGRGVPCDRRQALHWYRRAARQGHGRAMNLLGRCLEEGWGCSADPVAALRWYERSAHTGYFRGQFNYAAVLAQHGHPEAAASWYLQAAGAGDHAIRGAIVTALTNATAPALQAARRRVLAMCRGPS
ncbi:MAG TPA: tetratricopeptide repeat protein [Steroidobacteraceae bacterium]|nr:tetratricopeptide repeat protein [Steroidobacteraceae bacterium]